VIELINGTLAPSGVPIDLRFINATAIKRRHHKSKKFFFTTFYNLLTHFYVNFYFANSLSF